MLLNIWKNWALGEMVIRRRKYSRFPVAEPDCKWSTLGTDGGLTVKVFGLNGPKTRIEYNWPKKDVPPEIKAAVELWVKTQKFGGLSLEEFMLGVLKP